jgi:hypothetical protein
LDGKSVECFLRNACIKEFSYSAFRGRTSCETPEELFNEFSAAYLRMRPELDSSASSDIVEKASKLIEDMKRKGNIKEGASEAPDVAVILREILCRSFQNPEMDIATACRSKLEKGALF